MKDIGKELIAFLISAFKEVDLKPLIYKLFKEVILPEMKKRVDDSSSKIDDVIYKGVEAIVEKFLNPSPQIEAPKA